MISVDYVLAKEVPINVYHPEIWNKTVSYDKVFSKSFSYPR